jgi:hypothetical protein
MSGTKYMNSPIKLPGDWPRLWSRRSVGPAGPDGALVPAISNRSGNDALSGRFGALEQPMSNVNPAAMALGFQTLNMAAG